MQNVNPNAPILIGFFIFPWVILKCIKTRGMEQAPANRTFHYWWHTTQLQLHFQLYYTLTISHHSLVELCVYHYISLVYLYRCIYSNVSESLLCEIGNYNFFWHENVEQMCSTLNTLWYCFLSWTINNKTSLKHCRIIITYALISIFLFFFLFDPKN